jgi:hypothetical protein
VQKAGAYEVPQLPRKAMVQIHCHHNAVFGKDSEVELLKRMGLDAEVLDAGCCGMAGSFGFEADKHEISMKVGEQALLPKIRQADSDTLVIADGFSCQTQIEQGSQRQPIHIAQALQMAIHADGRLAASRRREARPLPSSFRNTRPRRATIGLAIAAGTVAAGIGLFLYQARKTARA